MQVSDKNDIDGLRDAIRVLTPNFQTWIGAALDELVSLRARADAQPVFTQEVQPYPFSEWDDEKLERIANSLVAIAKIVKDDRDILLAATCLRRLIGLPKASAPGLSDPDIQRLARKYLGPATAEKIPESIVLLVRECLTRASAATAAEPSAGEEIHVNVQGDDVYTLPLQPTGMETPRFVVHVPAAEEAPNRRADELEAFKAYNPLGYKLMDGLLVWRAACAWQRAAQQQANPLGIKPQPLGAEFDKVLHDNLSSLYIEDGKQQAEPGADEQDAFEAWASKRRMDLRREANDPDEYLLASTADAFVGWQGRAAQSGQRAGVAEDANLLRDAAEKGLDINQQPQLGCVEVWAGKGDDALVFREYYSRHADREAATKCALKRALAAPTQQQEGA